MYLIFNSVRNIHIFFTSKTSNILNTSTTKPRTNIHIIFGFILDYITIKHKKFSSMSSKIRLTLLSLIKKTSKKLKI